MKPIIVFGSVLVLLACATKEPKPKLRYMEMVGEDRGLSGGIDTIDALHHHTERDSLVGETTFAFASADHVVRAWRDDHYAPIDGGSFWLELDTMGRIYSHSTVWPGFSVIHTDNDSINELITMAIAAASRPGHFGILDPLPRIPEIETVQFMATDSLSQ